mmetsp:Transcript_27690/g.90183  ORF Transcript_27690/g.90183 Transcript_27690/m.90183 type:complete len:271 (+) Transcript_27690:1385-2197(+)
MAHRRHNERIALREEGTSRAEGHLLSEQHEAPRVLLLDQLGGCVHLVDVLLVHELSPRVVEGDGDLDEEEVLAVLREPVEDVAKGRELERDARERLQVVVPAQDDLLPRLRKLRLPVLQLLRHLGFLEPLAQSRSIDADVARPDVAVVSVEDQEHQPAAGGSMLDTQQGGAAGEEVSSVVVVVELDEVGVQQGVEDLFPDRQGAEDFRGGEGGVEEKADVGSASSRANERRGHEKLEVKHEDDVSIVEVLHHGSDVAQVHRVVQLPLRSG